MNFRQNIKFLFEFLREMLTIDPEKTMVEYLFQMGDHGQTPWQSKGVAAAVMTLRQLLPKDYLAQAKQVPATLYFEDIFGSASVAKGLNILVVISSFGDILAVMLLDMSRVIQECGRQGVILIMIIAPPARDDFNSAVDLRIIPESFFDLLMGVGLLITRRRHKRLGLPARTYRAWDIAVYFNILKNVYLLVMPWYLPDGSARAGEVSFWHASYAATGVGM
ncbi:hypothetical protein BDV23DRAFT_180202 [Aspergillus alliaceus]|uniref:Uncharacterized protein n=1 Tax=Petromyces alliaceus TaxID=209559 RepID=A0A5N7CJV5_PETAA|nr:hypothetical protein BDV23DRAFT_180202 [Aspergillus alliaceus]